ncbi:hypothetical protein HRbin12_01453 [bacterium HR12]|nr:hypothetical protein HRbin12_01453 [bacterium HR12]
MPDPLVEGLEDRGLEAGLGEGAHDRGRHPGLHLDRPSGVELHPAHEPSGGGEDLADLHPEVERPQDRHRVDLRLPAAAHRAAHRREAPVAVGEDRHEGVRRPLPADEHVGVTRVEHEGRAAVVADDAGLGLPDPRAEAVVEALDERDRPALRVGRDERDRVAPRSRPPPLAHRLGETRQVPLVEELPDGHPGEPRVGVVAVAIGGGGGEDLGEGGRVRAEGVGVDAEELHSREDLEEHEALRVGRHHAHVQVPVPRRQGRVELGLVPGEVVEGHRRADGAQPLDEALADGPAVQRGGPEVRDPLQRRGEGVVGEGLALEERSLVGEEHRRETGVGAEPLLVGGEAGREGARRRHALARGADGGLERPGQAEAGPALGEEPTAGDGARHGDRQRPVGRHRAVLAPDLLVVDPRGGGAARVQRDRAPVGLLDQREEVAAHPAHVRVDDGEGRGGGEGGVDRVAAGLEGGATGLRGPDVGGREREPRAAADERAFVHAASVAARRPLNRRGRGRGSPRRTRRPAGARRGGSRGPGRRRSGRARSGARARPSRGRRAPRASRPPPRARR